MGLSPGQPLEKAVMVVGIGSLGATWNGALGWRDDPDLAAANVILANANTPLAGLLETDPRSIPPPPTMPAHSPALWVCPQGGGPMTVIERLTALQLRDEMQSQRALVDTSTRL